MPAQTQKSSQSQKKTKLKKKLRIDPAGDFALALDGKSMVPAQELRCPGCGRFLGYYAIVWGIVRVKCTNSKCKEWVTIDISPEK